jgi:hypothetical protein
VIATSAAETAAAHPVEDKLLLLHICVLKHRFSVQRCVSTGTRVAFLI